jgi:hypothetical protein
MLVLIIHGRPKVTPVVSGIQQSTTPNRPWESVGVFCVWRGLRKRLGGRGCHRGFFEDLPSHLAQTYSIVLSLMIIESPWNLGWLLIRGG